MFAVFCVAVLGGSLIFAVTADRAGAGALPAAVGAAPAGKIRHDGGLVHKAQGSYSLSVITDSPTGIRLGIPYGIVGSTPKGTKYGSNWSASGDRLNIDTLRILGDYTVSGLRAQLRRSPRGLYRRVTRDETIAGGFIVEGTDSGSRGVSTFYVEAHSQGGELRVLSLVYSNAAHYEFRGVIEEIKRSFVPFLSIEENYKPTPPPAPPAGRIAELERNLQDLIRKHNEATDRAQVAEKRLEEALKLREADKGNAIREKKIRDDERENAKRDMDEMAKRIDDALRKSPNPDKTDTTLKPKLPGLPGKRVALLIGIDKYSSLTKLDTAGNDVKSLGRVLRRIGFSVIEARDLDLMGFLAKWHEFVAQIEPGGTAAFFFAGHGVQIGGKNYLLPADTSATITPETLSKLPISFDHLRRELLSQKPGLGLFILDACRNNPFQGSQFRTFGTTRGLAVIEKTPSTFVMYSAAPGQLALDRFKHDGEDANSIFVRKLVPLLDREGLTLQDVAVRVRQEVHDLAATVNHPQWPEYYDGIIGKGYMCWSGDCIDRLAQQR